MQSRQSLIVTLGAVGLIAGTSVVVVFGVPSAPARQEAQAGSGDWPQWGGSPARNNAPEAANIASDWEVGKYDRKLQLFWPGTSRNIKWVARLGRVTHGTPVIAHGMVYIGTNNERG